MINKNRLIKLTKDLISINSENPPGQEAKVAQYVKELMLRMKGPIVRTYAFSKGRPNVIGILKGKGSKGSLLLSPHMDTVPAGKNWKRDPFKPKISEGRLFGRGATDCKGNLAVSLEIMQSLSEEKIVLNRDVIIAATVDEETGSHEGMIKLLERKILKPHFAMILDSDDFKVIIAQKGLIHFKVKIFGKKAHGAYPDRGVNAIEIASRVIGDLGNLNFHFRRHAYLKAPTINIGKISGGEKVNIVADYCEFEVDLRFLPGMNPAQILKQIKKIISSRIKKFSLHVDSLQVPYEISKRHTFIRGILESDKRFTLSGSEGATVITFFKRHKIPAVATGFGSGGCAHIADEYVKVSNLYRGALALEKFIKEF
ncbi:MAG: M20 family metallopeptidase [Candidatus Omnitrophica bacterium]|nr:M20 family metallopeptidase [Candidatus Omnitrophota bacterium]